MNGRDDRTTLRIAVAQLNPTVGDVAGKGQAGAEEEGNYG